MASVKRKHQQITTKVKKKKGIQPSENKEQTKEKNLIPTKNCDSVKKFTNNESELEQKENEKKKIKGVINKNLLIGSRVT